MRGDDTQSKSVVSHVYIIARSIHLKYDTQKLLQMLIALSLFIYIYPHLIDDCKMEHIIYCFE
jgi:hypothetical protein